MILVFGGAYQGKLEYALDQFDMTAEDVYRCSRDGEMDLSKTVRIRSLLFRQFAGELEFGNAFKRNTDAADL